MNLLISRKKSSIYILLQLRYLLGIAVAQINHLVSLRVDLVARFHFGFEGGSSDTLRERNIFYCFWILENVGLFVDEPMNGCLVMHIRTLLP